MKVVEYVIQDEVGLHARPASKLVQSLSKFQSSIFIEFEGKKANAKSIINLMSLGVTGKSKVLFHIEGADEEELSNSLVGILSEHGI
ncbi:phosphocarrier protein HPr [Mycoplasma wenyonii str. Massachusetts]|uniref:Phosphocarrier protein HPr n=1 Tax=Mycoplasma wenyonii (strain Massachusetts) TaxID=1197325 RepID=I6ZJ10_MYCWM|nr:HPr family phosphocarrier protein [Mycoplasma wenyonii]AFN65195.1 phosphocarrier protein HPr [Mycoplasma wenyonii str. Massachusetts]